RDLLEQLVDIRSAETDDPDGSNNDARYTRAFRSAGIDVDAMGPEAAADRIKARPARVALALAAAFDHWADRRYSARPQDKDGWLRLVAPARAADPAPQRDQLRSLVSERQGQLESLRKLAQQADPRAWPVQSLTLLARVLTRGGDPDTAVALLRRAQTHHPGE